jgi:pimeloyl-ACP methyl ester carboxylesterase
VSNEGLPTDLKLPWRRWAKLAVWTFVIGYAVVLVLFTVLQRYLIYVPRQLTPDLAEQTAARAGFVRWNNKAGQFIGWKLPASSAPIGSVLIVHGNAGWALNRAYIATPIHEAAPLDVYILEYPGFGARKGSPGEASLLLAGEEALENLPDNLPAYVVSESLGTGVAAHLAQKYPSRVAGLAMFVPYNKLASVAENHVPFIPAYFLLWDRYNPEAWLKNYRGPVKIIVAGADEIIPPILGKRLYDGYQGPKILQVIPGARHIETADQPPEWWREMLVFWQRHAVTNRVASSSKKRAYSRIK